MCGMTIIRQEITIKDGVVQALCQDVHYVLSMNGLICIGMN